MIPDTIGGAFTLTLVNLLVVFVVLILVALMISLIYKIVSSFQKETYTEIEGTEVQGEGYVEVGRVGVIEIRPEAEEVVTSVQDFESLDPKRKAAIIAAVYAYMGGSEVPVFLRGVPDAGAWGKTSRWMIMNE